MTSHSSDDRSEYLRERAKELLAYARTMNDLELRRDVETIAKSYERLADFPPPREHAKDDGERQKRGTPKVALHTPIKVESQADAAGE